MAKHSGPGAVVGLGALARGVEALNDFTTDVPVGLTYTICPDGTGVLTDAGAANQDRRDG